MNKKIMALVLTLLVSMLGVSNVKAYEASVTLKEEETVYVKTNWSSPKIYFFHVNDDGMSSIQIDWPGYNMTKVENGIWKYTISASDHNKYDMIIFNNGSGSQTIDLSSLGGGLIYTVSNTLNSEGKYEGVWSVYDKSELKALVEEAKECKEVEYTIATFSQLQEKLEIAEDILAKDYTADEYLVVYDYDAKKYTSDFEEAVNELQKAIDDLEERNSFIVKEDENGTIKVAYETNSDTALKITVTPNNGYELTELKVTNIIGYYTDNTPILGDDIKVYTLDDTNIYDYTLDQEDVYIEATYKKIETITDNSENDTENDTDNTIIEDTKTNTDNKTNTNTNNPSTGDTITKYIFGLILSLIALISIAILQIRLKKQNQNI